MKKDASGAGSHDRLRGRGGSCVWACMIDRKRDRCVIHTHSAYHWRLCCWKQDWKKANVIPIPTKDKQDDLGNYSPGSFTLIPGKIVEQLTEDSVKELKGDKIINYQPAWFYGNESPSDDPDMILQNHYTTGWQRQLCSHSAPLLQLHNVQIKN